MTRILYSIHAVTSTLMGLLLTLAGEHAFAKTPDGETPAQEQVCSELSGAALGLCNAYCAAQDCDVQPGPLCDQLRFLFQRVTGDATFPCEAQGPACGNGVVEAGEQCDDSNSSDTDACKTDCTPNTCGDGVVNIGIEQCEDGNTTSGDGCSTACQFEAVPPPDCPVCGNGIVEPGEVCDGGAGCSAFCLFVVCGNGFVDPGEQCDDGNTSNADSCLNSCVVTSCGDTFVSGFEACDDGNVLNGDGCSAACQAEFCGDGLAQAGIGEQCDDGDLVSGDGCSAACQREVCGDGVRQEGLGEQCDDGNLVNGDGCSAACQTEGCGNSILDAGEQCDDGNDNAFDGCDECILVDTTPD